MTEAAFTRQVLDYAVLFRWRRLHIRPARTKKGWRTPVAGDGLGFPDLVLLRGPRCVVAELKVGTDTTPSQEAWLAAWRKIPGAEVFVWRPDSWPEIEEVLGSD